MSSSSAWSTDIVLGHLGLHKQTFSPKKNNDNGVGSSVGGSGGSGGYIMVEVMVTNIYDYGEVMIVTMLWW